MKHILHQETASIQAFWGVWRPILFCDVLYCDHVHIYTYFTSAPSVHFSCRQRWLSRGWKESLSRTLFCGALCTAIVHIHKQLLSGTKCANTRRFAYS